MEDMEDRKTFTSRSMLQLMGTGSRISDLNPHALLCYLRFLMTAMKAPILLMPDFFQTNSVQVAGSEQL